jgi:YD repeat-containing protein
MKATILTTFILLSGITFAQNEVAYTYDDAGNRIKREGTGSGLIIQPNNNESTAMENIEESGVALEAHPNPTAGKTAVSVLLNPETISKEHKTAIESGVSMQLIDISGKVLKTQKGSSLEQTFNLQGLSKGVYFVKVFTKNGQLVGERKVVKE